MQKVTTTILLILFLACFAALENASVKGYNVGVSAGYLKYDVNLSVTAGEQSFSQSGRFTVDITKVNDTVIEGTIEESDITGSLPTGLASPLYPGKQPFSIVTLTWTSSYSSLGAIIIPAGLKVGDSVPEGGEIQNLTKWNGRTAVVIKASEVLGIPGSAEFDNQTGAFLEAGGSTSYEGYYLTTISIKLTDTNLFSITPTLLGLEWWVWAIAIVVIVGAALGTLVLTRRRRQPVAQPRAKPSLQPPA